MIEIVERFITISGEAPIIGEPIYLVRFSKCNLDCSYCDTMYKNEVNECLSVEELKADIIEKINDYPELKVLFTGGEPLLGERQEKLLKIIEDLKYINFYIETNGSIPITNFNLPNCHFVADWKAPSSGEEDDLDFCIENLRHYRIDEDCIKFVISRYDLEWLKDVIRVIEKMNPFLPLYVSAQWGEITLKEIADFILINKLPLKISIQLHKIIWEPEMRGV
jgi:7-carboxy-7-deazaguanine synthase